jgi:hypothetical protein
MSLEKALRLTVITGVTVTSKFFSDMFYTNSRYTKVGGLPHFELNQLELLVQWNLSIAKCAKQNWPYIENMAC